MKASSFGIMSALVLSSVAQAQGLPPNRVECKGEDLALLYNATSYRGDPQFYYEHGAQSASVDGTGKILTESTVLGELVTITRRSVADYGSETVTLIVPAMNLRKVGDEVAFATRVVESWHNTTIGGPGFVNGLVTESSFIPVSCKGSIVAF